MTDHHIFFSHRSLLCQFTSKFAQRLTEQAGNGLLLRDMQKLSLWRVFSQLSGQCHLEKFALTKRSPQGQCCGSSGGPSDVIFDTGVHSSSRFYDEHLPTCTHPTLWNGIFFEKRPRAYYSLPVCLVRNLRFPKFLQVTYRHSARHHAWRCVEKVCSRHVTTFPQKSKCLKNFSSIKLSSRRKILMCQSSVNILNRPTHGLSVPCAATLLTFLIDFLKICHCSPTNPLGAVPYILSVSRVLMCLMYKDHFFAI